MAHKIITAPTLEPVTLAEAKAQCRVDSSDEDALLAIYIASARESAEHITGRKFMQQTWEMQLDEFPCNEIKLPFKNVTTIDSVKYLDATGTLTTINQANYTLLNDTLEDWVILAYGQAWPVTYDSAQAVRIQFKAGTTDVLQVPAGVRQWILLAVGLFYKNRETANELEMFNLPRNFADGLLDKSWVPVL